MLISICSITALVCLIIYFIKIFALKKTKTEALNNRSNQDQDHNQLEINLYPYENKEYLIKNEKIRNNIILIFKIEKLNKVLTHEVRSKIREQLYNL